MKTQSDLNRTRLVGFAALLFCLASAPLFAAEGEGLDTDVKLKHANGDQDTSIMIKKGAPLQKEKRYEIIGDTEELMGIRVIRLGLCQLESGLRELEKEIKDLNNQPDHSIISLSCGIPKSEKSPEMVYTYTSKASYKARVSMIEPVSGR